MQGSSFFLDLCLTSQHAFVMKLSEFLFGAVSNWGLCFWVQLRDTAASDIHFRLDHERRLRATTEERDVALSLPQVQSLGQEIVRAQTDQSRDLSLCRSSSVEPGEQVSPLGLNAANSGLYSPIC